MVFKRSEVLVGSATVRGANASHTSPGASLVRALAFSIALAAALLATFAGTAHAMTQPQVVIAGPLDLVAAPFDGVFYEGGVTPDTGLTPPTVTKVEPAEGPAAGGTVVTITGTGFTEGALVKVGSAATEVEYKSATELTAKTAATAIGKDEVFVTDSKGVNGAGPDFTYNAAPKVTSVSPAEGSTEGGTAITLKGSDFVSGAKVTLAGEEATSVVVVSPTEITAKTPKGAAGKDEVVVSDADGVSSAGAGFTYITPPTVTAISPKEGTTAGGTAVKITGTGFVKGAKVKIGKEATGVTVVSGTEITAKTAAESAGEVEVEVSVGGVAQSATVKYKFAAPPTVTKVEPAEGTTAGGTVVTITGTGFVEHSTVKVGGVAASEVEYKSATELKAKTGAHAAGKVEVVVADGEVSSVVNGSFTYIAPPTVTSISPKEGTTAGGTPVKIKGTGFLKGAKVTIGKEATGVTVVSETEITAKTAAESAGEVEVEVSVGGVAQSASTKYKFAAAPTVTKVEPAEGPAAGGTVVTITGTGFVEHSTVKIGAAATEVEYKSATELKAKTAATAAGKDEVVVTSGEISSTGGQDFTYNAAPKVTSVSPAEGSTEGGTAITLKGSDFVSGAKVTLAGEEATSVVVVSPTEITAKTPKGAAGKDEVVVSDADGVSSAGAGFTYITPPTVTAISPKEGTTAGGTAVKITGTGFVKGAKVKIGKEATGVTVVSGTEITAKTAAESAGEVEVEVSVGGVAQSATVKYKFAAPPTVTKVEPAEGTTAGGTVVTITGTGFVEHSTVKVGGVAASEVEYKSATELKAKTGAHAAGKVEVVVADGEVSSVVNGSFTYIAPPTVTSISPKEGTTAGGTPVKIKGTGFLKGAKVTIGKEATGVTVVSETEITAKTAAESAGEVEVEVSVGGVAQSASTKYKFAAAPTVTKVEPAEGPAAGGTVVTITGTGFVEHSTVKIGAAATEVEYKSATELKAKTAATAAGKDEVVVTSGEISSTGGQDFTYNAAPKVTSVSPAEGSTEGGTAITLKGSDFVSGAKVTLAGEEATSVVVVSPTEITAKTPKGAAGKDEVVVSDADGVSSAGAGFTYITPPTVTAISPKEGTTAGGTAVKITGTGFVKGAKVKIGKEATGVTVVSGTEITAKTAAESAGEVEVEVSVGGVAQSATVKYKFAAPPTVTKVEPAEGTTAGGTVVTITGTGFVEHSTVKVGGVAASEVEYKSATELKAKTGAHAAGKVEVVVADGEVSSVVNGSFTYIAPPTVTSISPKEGTTAGGTPVKIKGTGFLKGAKVTIGKEATGVTVVSETEITAKTAAESAGEVEVEVSVGGVAQSASTKYKFAAAPTVTKVEPAEGPAAGGTVVTITGTGFVEHSTVKIGAAATEVEYKSATELKAKTAATAAGKDEVVVTSGEISSTGGQDFTYNAAPKVSGITPAEGSTAGGTAITLKGSDFVSGAKVTLAGEEATSVVVVSPTEITAKTPKGAAGKDEVVVSDADGVSSAGAGFTYITPPTVTAISPKEGTTAGGTAVKITGTGFVKGAKVKIGKEATGVTVVSGTEITAKTAAESAGEVEVEVSVGGVAQSATVKYKFAAPPTVTKVEPAEGTTAGGTVVTITGTGFVEHSTVKVGGVAASEVEYKSATELKAKTGAHAAGKVEVVVADGEVSSVVNGSFTYIAPPTVTSISPKEGTTAGGTPVKIKGTGFLKGAKVTIGKEATGVTVVSETEITAKTAAESAGEVEVEVSVGGVAQSASTKYKFAAAPTVTKVEPAEGPAAGGTVVTITGTGFVEHSTVKIGAAATEVEYKSATELKAKTAATAAGKDEVVVTSGEISSTGGQDFTYNAAPKVSGITPAEGSTAGGTAITLKGSDFVSGAKVTLAGEEATSVVVVSPTEITAKTPKGAAGKDEVVVSDADGVSSAGAGFTYITPPTVTAISPKEGTTAGGTAVKITGTGFVKGAKVKIGGEPTSIVVVSATEITAKTTAHAAGEVPVEVSVGGVAQSATVEFTYATPPKVTSISPPEGSTAGGWEVLVTGTGFSEHAKVKIGGTEAEKVEWISATELVVTTGAHAAGKAEVVVTNGELSSSGGPMYTYVA